MKIDVTSTVTLPVTPTATVHYVAGTRVLAPRAHIERIEAARAGKRVKEPRAKAAMPASTGNQA